MSFEEFLEWCDEDTLAEWVDGRVIMTSPASARHQLLALFLAEVLDTYVTMHDLGEIYIAPFQMKLARRSREPDILFVAKAHVDRVKPTYLNGPADLVVEIASPESSGRDRGDKFYEYREAGIPEYWLIDPHVKQAEFYQLTAQSHYQPTTLDAGQIYRCRVLPGFWLRVDWLWQWPLPNPARALFEIDRETYTHYLETQAREANNSPRLIEGDGEADVSG